MTDHNLEYTATPRFKLFVRTVGVIGISAGAAMFELKNSFLWHPRAPQPETGMVVPYTYKGLIFYISSKEYFWIRAIDIVFFVALSTFFLIGLYLTKTQGFRVRGVRPPPHL